MPDEGSVSKLFEEKEHPSQDRGLTFYQKLLVQHAHPTKLIFDTIAYTWAVYFLSRHELAPGLIVLFGVGSLGTALTAKTDKEALANTALGRFFLLSAHPINSFFQIIGYAIILFGAWHHHTAQILLGVTCILIGHLWGWSRIDSRLASRINSRTLRSVGGT